MSALTTFPSLAWFEMLAAHMTEETQRYRDLGACDCCMVVKVDQPDITRLIEVQFRGYAVESIRELDSIEDATADHFVVEATLEVWREMIENIEARGEPDLEHTLNYLTFPDDPMVVDGPDQLMVDAFYRYNQSLQQFFNGAAALVAH
jgi:hypothetical protein